MHCVKPSSQTQWERSGRGSGAISGTFKYIDLALQIQIFERAADRSPLGGCDEWVTRGVRTVRISVAVSDRDEIK